MTTTTNERQHLLEFLDTNVFKPALAANASSYIASGEARLLAKVQKSVAETRTRYYQNYKTAGEVKDRFFRDLRSPVGQALRADMWRLKLKAFEDYIPQFKALCKQFGL